MIDYLSIVEFIPQNILNILIASALGFFVGLEREGSQVEAGIRTFTLISLTGLLVSMTGMNLLAGVAFIGIFALLLASQKLIIEDFKGGLLLTTSISMLVVYLSGILVGKNMYLEAITISIISSSLLFEKQRLHSFADNLTKDELRSAAKLAAISFLVYPILPSDTIGPYNSIEPRLVWLLIIAISTIGFVNYIILRKYGQKGSIVSSFFGGLVNSTATVVEISERYVRDEISQKFLLSTSMITNSAMCVRNFIIVVLFVPSLFLVVGFPLLSMSVAGVLIAYYLVDFKQGKSTQVNLESPFSIKKAFLFGGLFVIVVLLSSFLQTYIGDRGVVIATFLAGLISSGSAITSVVLLRSTEQITLSTTLISVLAGTFSSILVKVIIISINDDKIFKVLTKTLKGDVDKELVKEIIYINSLLIIVGILGSLISIIYYNFL